MWVERPLCHGRFLQNLFLSVHNSICHYLCILLQLLSLPEVKNFFENKTVGELPWESLGKTYAAMLQNTTIVKYMDCGSIHSYAKLFFQLNYQSTKWHQFRISTYIALVFFYFEHLRPSLCHWCKIKEMVSSVRSNYTPGYRFLARVLAKALKMLFRFCNLFSQISHFFHIFNFWWNNHWNISSDFQFFIRLNHICPKWIKMDQSWSDLISA